MPSDQSADRGSPHPPGQELPTYPDLSLTLPARAENVAPATTLSTPQPSAAALSPATPRALADDHEQLYALGRKIFFDEQLSEPAGTSCASCHDPAQGYAGNHGSKLGVALGSRPGHFARRNTPSLLYLKFVRKFHFHWEEDAPIPDAVGGGIRQVF